MLGDESKWVQVITETEVDMHHNQVVEALHHNQHECHWSAVVGSCHLAHLGHLDYGCVFKAGGYFRLY